MVYACEFGHRNTDGTPKKHPSRRFCDLAVAYDRKHRSKSSPAGSPSSRRTVDVSAPLDGTLSRPTEPAPGGGPPAAGGAAPKRPSLGERLGFKYRAASTIQPTPPTGPGVAATVEWELNEAQSERFWSTIYSGTFRIINLILDWLEVKTLPPSITEPDEGQKYVFRSTLRGPATGVVQKVFRAKTPEEADDVIMGLGGLFTFGTTFAQVALHLAREIPKSPKIKEWKAKLAERRKPRAQREERIGGSEEAGRQPPGLPGLPAGAS